jgi:hypothetical protein
LSDEIQDMRAQLLALRQFASAFYASILVARPGPVTACQQLAKDGGAAFEKIFETGGVPNASPELAQRSLQELELIWMDVELALRRRGYTA